MTLREIVHSARKRLEQAGIPAPEAALDAELLARDVLAWDRAAWVAHQREAAPASFEPAFESLIERRATREPVAYIRGRQEFYGRDFQVSPAVLVPRPETELLIDEALLLLPALGFSRSLAVIDIGTGTGCLAITLALEYPRARYLATDVSQAALDVARQNAERFGVADRINFVYGSYFAGHRGPFNLVISNPPYVAEEERDTLAPEVGSHEPAVALFGGVDGLREVGEIIRQSPGVLDDDGSILLEIGYGQRDRVADIVAQTGDLALVRTRADLQGIPRVAVVRRCT